MAANLHVSISAEPVFELAGFTFTNSIITSLIVGGFLVVFAVMVRSSLKPTSKPTGLQNFAEFLIEAIYGLIQSVTGDHKRSRAFFPLISTFLLFILFNNWIGLFPGVGTIGVLREYEGKSHAAVEQQIELVPEIYAEGPVDDHTDEATHSKTEAGTDHNAAGDDHADGQADDTHSGLAFIPILRPGSADLNTTLALGIISVLATQILGVQFLGMSYFKKFFNFSNPIQTFVGFLEIISEFAKIISFAFRLFGNIFAGEVLLVVIGSLVPVIVPMPFYGLEIFVGFIQALVFAMLSLVFFNMATHSHD